MPGRPTILAAFGAFLAVAIGACGCGSSSEAAEYRVPGEPEIEFVSPRNGAVQRGLAVVVKVNVRNFRLAPRHFGGEPLLGEGNIRFSLNRVPDCVDLVKLKRAVHSPIGKGRLIGASFDYAEFSGPNGILGERVGSSGSYSPATRPEIFYDNLRPGFYRLIATLADNNGSTTPWHDVTSFQILTRPGHPALKCGPGKVPSAKAAAHE
jgi:hypothetical protein